MARTVDPERHLARRLVHHRRGPHVLRGAAATPARRRRPSAGRPASARAPSSTTSRPSSRCSSRSWPYGTDETRCVVRRPQRRRGPAGGARRVPRPHRRGAADPRLAGFVRAVGAVMGEPEVEAALALDTRVLQDGLEPWVARAQAAGPGAHRPLRARPDRVAARRARRVPRPARGGRGLHRRGPAGDPRSTSYAACSRRESVRLDPDQLVGLPLLQRHRHQHRHRVRRGARLQVARRARRRRPGRQRCCARRRASRGGWASRPPAPPRSSARRPPRSARSAPPAT